MSVQKGPGEGYMAAKADVLTRHPSLRCVARYWDGRVDGYVVKDGSGGVLGTGRSAREAWNAAGAKLAQATAAGCRTGVKVESLPERRVVRIEWPYGKNTIEASPEWVMNLANDLLDAAVAADVTGKGV